MIQSEKENIAVLMTCHNRREKTLGCLEKLKKQEGIAGINITIYLLDDGSTDGTSAAVRERYPTVIILEGDGNLFWTRGMHKAMGAAIEKGFDFYLWLNDDVMLYEYALKNLLNTFNKINNQHNLGIVIGSVCDPVTKEWTYGASRKTYSWYPLRFTPIEPNQEIKEADNFYGNVVLIPDKIVKDVGNLDWRFIHGAGDHDYAHRVKKMEYKIWMAPNYVGECSRNSIENTWEDDQLGLLERYRKMFDIKAMPLETSYYYTRKHGGFFFPLIIVFIYIKLPFMHVFSRMKNWINQNLIDNE